MVSVRGNFELTRSDLSPWRIKRDVTFEEVGLTLLRLNLIVNNVPLLLSWCWHSYSFLWSSSIETVYVRISIAFIIMLHNLFRLLLSQIWVQSLHIWVMISLHVNFGSGGNLFKWCLEEWLWILSLVQKTDDIDGTLSFLNHISAPWPIRNHLLRWRGLLESLPALSSQEVNNTLLSIFSNTFSGTFNMVKSWLRLWRWRLSCRLYLHELLEIVHEARLGSHVSTGLIWRQGLWGGKN